MSTLEAVHPSGANRASPSMRGWARNARALCLPLVAVVAIAGLGAGIFAAATEPQTAPLRHEITSLNGGLTSADHQILVLQTSLRHVASQASRLHAAVGSLEQNLTATHDEMRLLRHRAGVLHHDVGNLQSTVGQLNHAVRKVQGDSGFLRHRVGALRADVGKLQSSDNQLRAQSATLLTCVADLQHELDRTKVTISKVGARMTGAFLAKLTIISRYCATTLFGP
jgi:chromosome segregation ATPase